MTDGVENLDKLATFLAVPRELATEQDWEFARAARRADRKAKEARKRANRRRDERAAFISGDRWI